MFCTLFTCAFINEEWQADQNEDMNNNIKSEITVEPVTEEESIVKKETHTEVKNHIQVNVEEKLSSLRLSNSNTSTLLPKNENNTTSSDYAGSYRMTLSNYATNQRLLYEPRKTDQSITSSIEKQDGSSKNHISKTPSNDDDELIKLTSISRFVEHTDKDLLSDAMEQYRSWMIEEQDDIVQHQKPKTSSGDVHAPIQLMTMSRYMQLRDAGLLPDDLYRRPSLRSQESTESQTFKLRKSQEARKFLELEQRRSRSTNDLTLVNQKAQRRSMDNLAVGQVDWVDASGMDQAAQMYDPWNVDEKKTPDQGRKRKNRKFKIFSRSRHTASWKITDDPAHYDPVVQKKGILRRVTRFLFGDRYEDYTQEMPKFY
jgi:protein-arginine kinase activator protein McsA